MKISLILPVYNVEQYVERCLLSCINQDVSSNDYEIIVINDGTKDNSLEIIQRIAKNNDNIIVFSQENAGLSAARNKGLSMAKGDYVWFIDTDDRIVENCLGEILNKLYVNNLEALQIDFAKEYDDGRIEKLERWDLSIDGIYKGIELLSKEAISYAAQFTIYKREFLLKNKLQFKYGVFHEDVEFTPRAYYFLNRCSIIKNRIYYFYYQSPVSILRSINPKKSYDSIEVANSLLQFSNDNVEKRIKHVYYNIISTLVNNSLKNILRSKTVDVRMEFNLHLYRNKMMFNKMILASKLMYRIEGVLFSIFPKKVVALFAIMSKKGN